MIEHANLKKIRQKLAAGEDIASALRTSSDALCTRDIVKLHSTVRSELLGAGMTIAPLLDDPQTQMCWSMVLALYGLIEGTGLRR